MSIQTTEKIVDGQAVGGGATVSVMEIEIGDSASQVENWTIWLKNGGPANVTLNIYSSPNGTDWHLYDTSTVNAATNGAPVQGYDESASWLKVEVVDAGAGSTVDCYFRGVSYGATS